MSRETKFGYGFLLVGAALPYLAEKMFSPLMASIFSILSLAIGILLLIAGHMHRDTRAAPQPRGTLAKFGVPVVVAALVLITIVSMIIALKRHGPPNQAKNGLTRLLQGARQPRQAGEKSKKPTVAPFAFTESLPDKVSLLLSNGAGMRITVTLNTAALEKEKFTGLLDLNGDRPITAYVQDGVFYVDATIMDLSGHKVVQIKKNKVEVMPAGWDMNFSANAVEVVDANQHPIFQMIRRRANVIQIAGLFVGKGGTMFDARPAKTLFKYPSWEFRGQYAPREPISQQDQMAAKRYSRMTDAELRSNVQQLCSKIRNLGAEWNEAYFRNNKRAIAAINSAKSEEEKEAYGTKRMTENEHEYKLLEARFDREYRNEGNLLAAELLRRVETPAEALNSEHTTPPLLQAGVAAGANPWDEVCNYLETLARRLP